MYKVETNSSCDKNSKAVQHTDVWAESECVSVWLLNCSELLINTSVRSPPPVILNIAGALFVC